MATFSSNRFVTARIHSSEFVSNNYLEDIKSTFGTGDVTNTYLIATFTSNNYIDGRFTSNNYVSTRVGLRATNTYVNSTFSSNNYLQDELDLKATNTYVNSTFTSNNYVDGKFTSNTFLTDTFTTNTYVDGRFASNTYVTSKLGLRATNTYVNSTFTSNNYVNDSFSSNTYLTGHFTTNNYIQSYVSSEVASLVDSAPATLDTLNELAAALGDDANFATTVSTQIGIRATNTYVNSTFSSNNYLQGLGYTTNTGDVSNNYLQSLGYTTNTGDVSNNYLQGLGFTTNVGDVTNTYLTATFSSNNYLQSESFFSDVRAIPQTTSTTVTTADIGKHLKVTGTVTINASTGFSSGDAVTIFNNSGSDITITATGITLYSAGTADTGSRTLAQRGLATALCVDTNVYAISGAGLS